MGSQAVQRRLAAILSADVVGYSRLMGEDEAGTLARLKAHRAECVDPAIAARGGRLVKLMGDGALVEEFLRVAEDDIAVFPGRKLADWEPFWHGAIEYQSDTDFEHLYDQLAKAGLEE